MAPTTEPRLPRENDRELLGETSLTDLNVEGVLPAGLCGRLLAIGSGFDVGGSGPYPVGADDGVVHSVHLDTGQCISYRNRPVITDDVAQRLGMDFTPGPRNRGADTVASNIISFGGLILALGEGTLAYELTTDLVTLRRVDLAGRSRGLSAYPKRDPATGDLHLLANLDSAIGDRAYVIVSSGAFTRASRPLAGAPNPILDLAITRDRVVFATDGFVGVASRSDDAPIIWCPTGMDAPDLVHAHEFGDRIVVYAVTPSLERWTLHAAAATVRREVLDAKARLFARTTDLPLGEVPRFLWTTSDGTADKHDLATGRCARHDFGPDRLPGDLVFVADTTRASDADGGWLVGFVHHTSEVMTDLVVLDAAEIAQPVIATVRIPRHVPRGLHSTWIPTASPATHNEREQP
jgi:8'-apo-carotenoid 13,14-cleaving dioxygenase